MAGESAAEVARRRREKAARLARQAEMFERGAAGERLTAAALDKLPGEWTRLHDRRWPGRRFANIDHVVVGPGGIFVIDSKNWSGEVKVRDSVLRQNGRSRERAVASAADAALAVAEFLPSPYQGLVSPVMCFAGADPLSGWARDVMVCSTQTLDHMLRTRPRVIQPRQVAEVARILDRGLRSASSSEPRQAQFGGKHWTRSGNPSAAPQSHPRGRRRRRAGEVVRLLIFLVVLLVLVANCGASSLRLGG